LSAYDDSVDCLRLLETNGEGELLLPIFGVMSTSSWYFFIHLAAIGRIDCELVVPP
jgi:hypothetical protein